MDDTPLDDSTSESFRVGEVPVAYPTWTVPPVYEWPISQAFPVYLPGQDVNVTLPTTSGRTESVYPVYAPIVKAGQRNTKYMHTHNLLSGYNTQAFTSSVPTSYPTRSPSLLAQQVPQVSQVPSQVPPQAPQVPQVPTVPQVPQVSQVSQTPATVPTVPTIQQVSAVPTISAVPTARSTPMPSAKAPSLSSVTPVPTSVSPMPSFYSNSSYSQTIPVTSNVSGVSALSGRPMPNIPVKSSISDNFMASLMEFMNKRGTPITTIPYIGDHQINLTALYFHVMRLGGSHKVTQANLWSNVAQAFGINLTMMPTAPQQLAECHKNYLSSYESWTYNQQLLMQQTHPNKSKHGLPQEQSDQQKNINYNTTDKIPSHFQAQHALSSKPSSQSSSTSIVEPLATSGVPLVSTRTYKPKKRVVDTYGGFDMELITRMGNDLENLRCRPPTLHELGTVNIYALIMSIKSGLCSEVNTALDILTIITGNKRWGLPLLECDELLDSIIEMADDEYSLLIPDIKVMDETISLLSYDQMVNLYYDETENLTVNYRPGSLSYEKTKSVEKILCITTILRNLTFTEENHDIMAKNSMLLVLIEHLVIMISKTDIPEISNYQRLDLAKDLIVLLSNISQGILVENESTAKAIIYLITAFSPDSNISSHPDKIIFTPYNPTLHPYLPAAIDALAKLFVRSFPNRHIFSKVMISISSKQCLKDNIFIRAFLLCLSPIPTSNLSHPIHTCEARLALLEHCTLAAESIVTIFPKESYLATSLLSADDGFLGSFVRLACLLSSIGGGRLPNQINNIESNPFSRFARRTINILHILMKKAKKEKPFDETYYIFSTITLKKEQLLGSLLTPHMDGMIIKNLWSLIEDGITETL